MTTPREGDTVVRSDELRDLGEVHPLKISCISWQKCTNHGSFSWFCHRDPEWLEHFEEQVLEILAGLTELRPGVAVGVGGDNSSVQGSISEHDHAAGMELALLGVGQKPDAVIAP